MWVTKKEVVKEELVQLKDSYRGSGEFLDLPARIHCLLRAQLGLKCILIVLRFCLRWPILEESFSYCCNRKDSSVFPTRYTILSE